MNRLLLVVLLIILSSLAWGRLASYAASNPTLIPPLPASFYGTVTQNGVDVAEGTPVSAWIDGICYATTLVFNYGGHTMYALDVPADDPGTPERDGGRVGDTIVFRLAGLPAAPTATWHGGTNTRLDLATNNHRYFLPLLRKEVTESQEGA